MPDTTTDVVKTWFAEVKCTTCRLKFWVPYAERHGGTKKAEGTPEMLLSARCKHCPTGRDFSDWTGQKRVV